LLTEGNKSISVVSKFADFSRNVYTCIYRYTGTKFPGICFSETFVVYIYMC